MISQSFEIRRVLEGRLKYIITISLKLFFFSPKIRLLCIIWRIPYKFLNWTQIGNPIFRWDIICNLMKRHLADWKTNLFTILAAYLLNPQNVQTSSKKYESKLRQNKPLTHFPAHNHHNRQMMKRVGSMSKWVLVSAKLSLTWRLRCSWSRLPGCKNKRRIELRWAVNGQHHCHCHNCGLILNQGRIAKDFKDSPQIPWSCIYLASTGALYVTIPAPAFWLFTQPMPSCYSGSLREYHCNKQTNNQVKNKQMQ